MKTIAFIPARGGSKTIPFKNIKGLNDKPLIYWVLDALEKSNVDEIVVATDSKLIRNICELHSSYKHKMYIYDRSLENARDESTTESVMLEFINQANYNDKDNFILVQCTNPFLLSEHINEALDEYNMDKSFIEEYGSMMSSTYSPRYIWDRRNSKSLNYDYTNRSRKQDYNELEHKFCLENGSFYINTIENIKRDNNRLSQPIHFYNMPWYSMIEIDTEDDWKLAEYIMKSFHIKNSIKEMSKIKLFAFDIDGCLTDGKISINDQGFNSYQFSKQDSKGLELLDRNIKICAITSEKDVTVFKKRFEKIHIDYFVYNCKDKIGFINNILKRELEKGNKIKMNEIAFIGDDIQDLELIKSCGISACPQNAISIIKQNSMIQLSREGGNGAIREFICKLMELKVI